MTEAVKGVWFKMFLCVSMLAFSFGFSGNGSAGAAPAFAKGADISWVPGMELRGISGRTRTGLSAIFWTF